eukprot:m.185972 g.185972  ORF g.185972 m.185972 type:complete len:249 (-) comp15585_c0_seq7:6119-6865(-)
MKERGDTLREVKFFDAVLGQASGGTIATAMHHINNKTGVKSRLGFDPLLKTTTGQKFAGKFMTDTGLKLKYDNDGKCWTGVFVMGTVNASCVRRSNAILNYSDSLIYRESHKHPNFFAAANALMQLMLLGGIIAVPPLKWLCFKMGVLPKPGSGPSEKQMDKGFLQISGIGYGTNEANKMESVFYFPTDAGYRDTARMLSESGLRLFDKESLFYLVFHRIDACSGKQQNVGQNWGYIYSSSVFWRRNC